ncbi:MAG: ROK family protein [Actinomycetia bacterium]|nr:ROK family protein [Actinomycetes bacterium]
MSTIGIDIGGTKALAVRLDDGVLVDDRHTATRRGALVDIALEAVRGVWADDVDAVGVGLAGLVQWPEGVLAWGPHVQGTNIPLKTLLEDELGVPVAVDNDANVAAFGERVAGAARGFDDFLLVTLGTGIGGAIMTDGSVYRGESFAGEWGHIRHDTAGLLCDCGKRGCWETVASGPALVRLAHEVMTLNPEGSLAIGFGSRAIAGEDVTAAADAGDEVARGLVAQVGSELGRGLANLIAIFDPELVVVGGGLGSVGESLLGPARRVAADALHGGNHRLLPPILVAGAGPRAGAIGAAYLASSIRS